MSGLLRLMRRPAFALAWAMTFSTVSLAQFEARTSVPVAISPFSVVVGDFNRDGKLDFAVAAYSLQIFLGNGDGTFQPPTNYLAEASAFYVAAADFNHDGKLDLVVSDLSGLFVLMGNGDGTFQTPTSVATPCGAAQVTTGDFNGDHNLDLLVIYGSTACNYVSVFLGNGDGTFREPPINTSPSQSPSASGVGDFNRDGKLDVAVAEQFGSLSQTEILLGNGDGTFSLGSTYAVNSDPLSVAVADFRGDGKLDLAVSSLYGGTEILLGNGDGTFAPGSNSPTDFAVWAVAADLNGDGKPDLAVAQFGNPGPPGAAVILNNGDGTFQPPVFYPAGKEPRSLAAGDFNGDHKTTYLFPITITTT